MLAYVFWHRPRGADVATYEERQRTFHAALAMSSASFRRTALPFGDGGGGYEDWYLAESWAALGELNGAAVDSARRDEHDRAASEAAEGWGGVYALAKGPATIPAGARWLEKPRGESSERFIAALPERTVWRRQMVLGPAPELCVATSESAGRQRIWPGDR